MQDMKWLRLRTEAINPKHEIGIPKQIQMKKIRNFRERMFEGLDNSNLDIVSDFDIRISNLLF